MLLEQGDMDSFLVLLEQAPKSADTEAETWMYRGVAREKARDWQAASEHFRKAIDLNPTVPKYYYRLAMAEERLGLRKQALAHIARTRAMNEARASCPPPMPISLPPRNRGVPAHQACRPPAGVWA